MRSENDRDDNLFPACIQCNVYKSDMPLETWRVVLQRSVDDCRRYYRQYRFAEKFGLVRDTSHPVKFYFEEYGNEL